MTNNNYIQMKTVLKSTPFVKARIEQDVCTCSNNNYHYLNPTPKTISSALLQFSPLQLPHLPQHFQPMFMAGRYIATTWIFHRKLAFTLYKFLSKFPGSGSMSITIDCILEP